MDKCMNESPVYLSDGSILSPHLFKELATFVVGGDYGPIHIQVLECENCGEVSLGWWRSDDD